MDKPVSVSSEMKTEFHNRSEAGRRLATKLQGMRIVDPLVFALPRGGVPVGFEIAQALNCPLDILVVRKLGSPTNPELGIGAIADGDVRVLDDRLIRALGVTGGQLATIEHRERQELRRRIKAYRGKRLSTDLFGRTVILVDDGLATGVSARAAVQAVLIHDPHRLIVAVPVCSDTAADTIRAQLRPVVDAFVCLMESQDFSSVGSWYRDFRQVSDNDVRKLLRRNDPKYYSLLRH